MLPLDNENKREQKTTKAKLWNIKIEKSKIKRVDLQKRRNVYKRSKSVTVVSKITENQAIDNPHYR